MNERKAYIFITMQQLIKSKLSLILYLIVCKRIYSQNIEK